VAVVNMKIVVASKTKYLEIFELVMIDFPYSCVVKMLDTMTWCQ
jgi:hypothetical protein